MESFRRINLQAILRHSSLQGNRFIPTHCIECTRFHAILIRYDGFFIVFAAQHARSPRRNSRFASLSLRGDLLKSNTFVEGVSHKIRHQIEELERISGVQSGALTVDGLPVDSYLTRFVWNEAKYPTMSPLREIVDGIHVQVAEIEDDLKVHVAEYNNVCSQLNVINRKQTGSLAVCDLSSLVKPGDIVISEHLVTLFAVVPKYSQKDWLSRYETFTTYVVPRSSKKLH